MQFSQMKNGRNVRHGFIKFPTDSPRENLTTCFSLPLCLQYTKDGFVPHLTWDLLKHVPDNSAPALIPLCSMYDLIPTLQSSGQKLSDFISSDFNRQIFLTDQDVLVKRRQGFNSSDFIPIWTESGRKNIYPTDLLNCVNVFKPDAYRLLADGETNKESSNKRLDKSVHNTAQLTKKSFNIEGQSCKIKPVFGSIVGGWNLKQRLISIEHLKSYDVDGYIIDGLLAEDLLNESTDTKENLNALITYICSHLPLNKPRALFGPLKPERVADAVSAGIDIFDSSYCSYLTSIHTALVLQSKAFPFEATSKLLNLADDSFKHDFTVIEKDCCCYTCFKGFTRAYLNHLINVKEMLGSILINLHNLYVYYDFFNQISYLTH
ncbi:queuine tRNA-ribosyltransferase accessory subunit 2 [Tetranychus urticae]|uniref:tRNA-guanine(15) transglycosylase-like domain-containing protein n=1 Tax=Tetranychus urticae TaxID=32264 RepID=T1KXN6_TETUR|nr:queuine tRNA-ribosyltransferase accessory subunit 2 [Tetranychus urticae]